MMDWFMLVPLVVFTRISEDFSQEIKTKYEMTASNFSSVDSANKNAVFPFVYVHAMQASEVGADLRGDEVNAGNFAFQIDVYDNKSQMRAREVMNEVVRIMKSMRFFVNSMPEFSTSDNVHRCTMRARRIIGAGDVL